MPVIEGSTALKSVQAEYDFAVDGGAVSTITLRSATGSIFGNEVANGAVVLGGYIEVDTILASAGAATVAVQLEGAADLLAATAFNASPWSTTGRKSVLPAFTGATSLKTTALRNIKIVVATAALTGGKFRVVLEYR